MRTLLALILFALGACSLSPETVAGLSDDQLVKYYHEFGDTSDADEANIGAEMVRRGVLTAHQLEMIREGRLAVGSSENYVLALLGTADSARRFSPGDFEVWDYWAYGQISMSITFKDGQVTSWVD